MRVLVDGTPLLGQRKGIGRYTAQLLAELGLLAQETGEVDPHVVGFTTRGWPSLGDLVPAGARRVGPPLPARALRALWSRADYPAVERLARTSVDVVHGTNFVLPPSTAPGVVTIHDLAHLDPRWPALHSPALAALTRRSVRRAAVVCTPTEAVAERLSELLAFPREQIVVTPLGVDPQWSAAASLGPGYRAEYGIPERYVLAVGAGSRKGLDTLVSAHAQLRARNAEAPALVLVGGQSRSREPGVLRLGHVPESVLRGLVAGAELLAMPSLDEGFGLPALEAFACGIPVVCSNIPALREVTGGLAALVPPGDSGALTEAIATELESGADPALRAARQGHAGRFTWRACAEATLAAYRLAWG